MEGPGAEHYDVVAWTAKDQRVRPSLTAMVDFDDPLDDEFPLGDGTVDQEGGSELPHCGEVNAIALDRERRVAAVRGGLSGMLPAVARDSAVSVGRQRGGRGGAAGRTAPADRPRPFHPPRLGSGERCRRHGRDDARPAPVGWPARRVASYLVSALDTSSGGRMSIVSDAGIQFLLRWIHFLAGITWIGLLYYFSFVQGPFFAEADAATKSAATQKLVRARWWFRWSAMLTFLSGLAVIGLRQVGWSDP
jgi:hypothetical protein